MFFKFFLGIVVLKTLRKFLAILIFIFLYEATMIKKIIAAALTLTSLPALANFPYYPIQFPRDEAAHYAAVPYSVQNLSEWWYYNGKLTTQDGRNFGYYISYNYYILTDKKGKKSTIPRFSLQIADIDNQKVYGNTVVYPANQMVASTDTLNFAYSNDVTLQQINGQYVVNAKIKSKDGHVLQVSMQLTPERDPLLVTQNTDQPGLVNMWNNTNSYYYSQTEVNTAGTIQIDDQTYTIDPTQSLSWMDHQWGDFVIVPGATQWIWSSVQLTNGLQINLSNIVDPKTKRPVTTNASIVMLDNSRVYTSTVIITPIMDPNHKHPLKYHFEIPTINLQFDADTYVPDQDVNGISEAISSVTGMWNGQHVNGNACVESIVDYKK